MRQTYETPRGHVMAECLTPEEAVALGGEICAADLRRLTDPAWKAYAAARIADGVRLYRVGDGVVGVCGRKVA